MPTAWGSFRSVRPDSTTFVTMAHRQHYLCDYGTQTALSLWLWHTDKSQRWCCLCAIVTKVVLSVCHSHKGGAVCVPCTTFVTMAHRQHHLCDYGTQTAPPLWLWHTDSTIFVTMAHRQHYLCDYGTHVQIHNTLFQRGFSLGHRRFRKRWRQSPILKFGEGDRHYKARVEA